MSIRRSKKNSRTMLKSSAMASPSSPTVHYSLLDCYNFLTPNEYSEKTFGVLAFLLRKSVGIINFSDLMHEAKQRHQHESSADFIALLEDRRANLPETNASIEKCLMLNRWITYIQENDKSFSMIYSHIRLYMKQNLVDEQLNPDIQYPEDFHQRESDFSNRKKAQDMRRLFYFSHDEVNKPSNLIHLKNRISKHLGYLLDSKNKNSSRARGIAAKELDRIFLNSFVIVDHPHNGVNPVLICERKGSGIYTMKISGMIVSLLHDFIQTHPGFIHLNDIELTLDPPSDLYRLDESHKLSWKTQELRACPGDKPQIIQYAELTYIAIQQTYRKDSRIHFAQALHTLKFTIKLHVTLSEYRFSKTHQITLESLPFAIGQYNSQIPQLLTRVILNDIRRFSMSQPINVETILYYIVRYFIHRTGVEPREDHKIYLEQELNKAMNARKYFRTLEDIYMDFLVPYVYQVEFMAKHPILAMLYADGLFLGPCNSVRTAEAMKRLPDIVLPKVALRFNSIRVDYEAIAAMPVLDRIITLNTCAVRIDIYNTKLRHLDRTKTIRYRTFDSSMLSNDISKFISKSLAQSSKHIRVLYNFNNNTNENIYRSFTEFAKYHHTRLHELSRDDEKYRLIYDLARNFDEDDSGDSLFSDDDDDDDDDSRKTGSFDRHSFNSVSQIMFNEKHPTTTEYNSAAMQMLFDSFKISKESAQKMASPPELPQDFYPVIISGSSSDSEHDLEFSRQFDDTVLTPVVDETLEAHQLEESHSIKLEMCVEANLSPEIGGILTSTEQEPLAKQTSETYLESPAVHTIRLQHETSSNTLVVSSTPTCCAEIVGLTLTITREYNNNQNPSTCPFQFQRNLKILVACLDKDLSTSVENSKTNSRKPIILGDELSCISKLLSIKDQLVYFIISATLAKLVIPLIHNYICIEHIYIQQGQNNIQSVTWMDGYSKIQGTWTSLQKIQEQVERDISSVETCPNSWSRTPNIFAELWIQKSPTTAIPPITESLKQSLEVPMIVSLCSIHPTPFRLSKEDTKTYEFRTVEDCQQFIKEQERSSIFLILIVDGNVIFNQVQSLLENDSIHALYIFSINNNNDKQDESISVCQNSKISGIFYNENDLLQQIAADICFFWQLLIHTPKMSMAKIEFDILSTLDENKKAFLSFQFLADILEQSWCVPDISSKISDEIETTGANLSSDLYVNSTHLILEIDRLSNQFDSISLSKATSHLRLINQQLESSMQKTYPFSITIYRAQLISDNDLKAIQTNKNNLIAIQTCVLASRSFSSAKRICRRACDNGLTAVLLEINVPKKTLLTYLDSDIIIFPLSTVFKIKSTTVAPDNICHIQLELADSTMELIKKQLYRTIGEHLTWLTFGNYLAHIKNYVTAHDYFKYLQSLPLNTQESASVYNNMALMYLLIDGKDQEALDCLKRAKELIGSNTVQVSGRAAECTDKHPETNNKADKYGKIAELHEEEGDYMYARLFYEKAIQCTIDPTVRKLYQLKIETLKENN